MIQLLMLSSSPHTVNADKLDEDSKNGITPPVYATLTGDSGAQHTFLPHHPSNHHHANGASPRGGSGQTLPQYSEVAIPGVERQYQELESSVAYYELVPSARTEEVREPQDYALPVALGQSTAQSHPYEVPVTLLHGNKVGGVCVFSMYVCIHVCMYVCTYVCLFVCNV